MLHSRGICLVGNFRLCGAESETSLHTIRDIFWANEVLSSLLHPMHFWDLFNSMDGASWVDLNLQKESGSRNLD